MKARSFVAGCVLAVAMEPGIGATFQNLDFESFQAVPDLPGSVILSDWALYIGTQRRPTARLYYNNPDGVEGISATVIDRAVELSANFDFVEGKYAVYFHQDYVNNSPFAIAQTATVPSDAKFLRFKVAGRTGFTPTLNGEVPALVERVFAGGVENPDVFSETANGSRKTYDISAFAGKDVELRFTVGYNPDGGTFDGNGDGILDSIELLTDYARFNRSSVKLDTNGFTLLWTSIPSSKFQVESATNFPAIWQPIGAPITSTNNTFIFTDTSVTNQPSSQRFYRLRAVP
jgi:hypothetical protein